MYKYLLLAIFALLLTGCVRTITLKNTDKSDPLLVVEGYINQQYPHLNYVILTRSADFTQSQTKPEFLSGAEVYVTEGERLLDGTFAWDDATKKRWVEQSGSMWIPTGQAGVYADSSWTMLGKEGKFYKLEIIHEGKSYTALTQIPKVVPIDSLTYQITTNPINDKLYGQIIVNYMEPLAHGNNYLTFYDSTGYTMLRGWGAVVTQRVADDQTINGVYRNEIRFTRFSIGDTVNYYLNTVDRNSYLFWQTQIANSGRPNPFTSGAPQPSNIKGENCTGNFTGMGVSHGRVVIQ